MPPGCRGVPRLDRRPPRASGERATATAAGATSTRCDAMTTGQARTPHHDATPRPTGKQQPQATGTTPGTAPGDRPTGREDAPRQPPPPARKRRPQATGTTPQTTPGNRPTGREGRPAATAAPPVGKTEPGKTAAAAGSHQPHEVAVPPDDATLHRSAGTAAPGGRHHAETRPQATGNHAGDRPRRPPHTPGRRPTTAAAPAGKRQPQATATTPQTAPGNHPTSQEGGPQQPPPPAGTPKPGEAGATVGSHRPCGVAVPRVEAGLHRSVRTARLLGRSFPRSARAESPPAPRSPGRAPRTRRTPCRARSPSRSPRNRRTPRWWPVRCPARRPR